MSFISQDVDFALAIMLVYISGADGRDGQYLVRELEELAAEASDGGSGLERHDGWVESNESQERVEDGEG